MERTSIPEWNEPEVETQGAGVSRETRVRPTRNNFLENNPMHSRVGLEILAFHVKQLGTTAAPISRETTKKWNKQ
jgi:hypothetical protein